MERFGDSVRKYIDEVKETVRFENCDLRAFCQQVDKKQIVLFGAGQALIAWIAKVLVDSGIDKQVQYIVDNGTDRTSIMVGNRSIPIFHPKKLKDEKEVCVVITNVNYMLEMYQQLVDMELDDTISVYVMHFIMAVSCGEKVPDLENLLHIDNRPQKIEKTINTFWFSNEPVPENYKRCIDSWYKYCPDFEIKIWNRDSYDCEQNSFMRKALSCNKWAFVSDYARVDVLYRNGGIYMDMDVEVVKKLDPLLGNDAFFSFDMHNDIGLEVFGTKKKNPLLKNIMDKYKAAEFVPEKMVELAQPRFIRSIVREFGVCLDGNMQCIEGMIFAPRSYFNPQDAVVFEYAAMDEKTYTIHRSNMAWTDQTKKNAAREKAKKLWKILNA